MEKIAKLMDLSEKVAVITGGGMGIGRAIALRLAECGAKVAIGDINLKAAQETLQAICQNGGTGIAVEMDVSNMDQVSFLMTEATQKLGSIGILVNNAGIINVFRSFYEVNDDVWNRTLDVNLKSQFLCAQAAAKIMIECKQGGSIVNMASIAAFRPTPGMVHYDCAKHGIIGLTRNLALILAPHGIRVNAIAPAGVNTPGTASIEIPRLSQEEEEAGLKDTLAHYPMRRFAEADEVARVAVFLTSDLSAMVTGETILVDGGYALV